MEPAWLLVGSGRSADLEMIYVARSSKRGERVRGECTQQLLGIAMEWFLVLAGRGFKGD